MVPVMSLKIGFVRQQKPNLKRLERYQRLQNLAVTIHETTFPQHPINCCENGVERGCQAEKSSDFITVAQRAVEVIALITTRSEVAKPSA